MRKNSLLKKSFIGLFFVGFIILGYLLGNVVANKDKEKYLEKEQSFLATVTEAKSWRKIYIQGLKKNEKDFRKAFELKLNNQVKYVWNNEEISYDYITNGDTIKVTFKGDGGDIYPALLDRVSEIELISDKKTRNMIKINNKIYYDMNKENEMGRCGEFDGYFIKDVKDTEVPTLNDTSNFGDYSYQIIDDKNIEVYIDGKWMIYTRK